MKCWSGLRKVENAGEASLYLKIVVYYKISKQMFS